MKEKHTDLQAIITRLGLEPLPVEGGLFAQTYRCTDIIPAEVLPERYPRKPRTYGTAIIYLFTDEPDSFSALHWLPSDEVYHFYIGDPVELLQLYPDGTSERVILGHDILNGQLVQHVVPRGVIQGSRLLEGGRFALIGTTMAPGFDETDYCGCEREDLVCRYPNETALIRKMTRPHKPLKMV